MSTTAHFSYTIVQLLRYGYLLLLPLLRLLIPGSNLWNQTVALQIATLAGMIVFFEFRRRTTHFHFSGKNMILEHGLLFRSRSMIRLNGRAVIHFKSGLIPRLLGGVLMALETDSAGKKNSPLSLYLSLTQSRRIAREMGFGPEELTVFARCGLRESFTCAVFSSDSHLGFLALAPLFKAGANLFDLNPAGDLIGAVSRLEQMVIRSIPPLFTTIAALLIAGYLLSLIYLTERNCRFILYTGEGKYAVAHGFLTRYTVLLPSSAFPAVTAHAGLLMQACSLVQPIAVTPNPSITGGKKTFLLPICSRSTAEQLLFNSRLPTGALKIPKSTAWRVYIPVIALSGSGCAAGFFGGEWFPSLRTPFSILALLLCTASFAALIPCSIRERRAFLSLPDSQIRNTRLTALERTRLNRSCAAIIIRQTPFQLRENLCSVEIRPHFSHFDSKPVPLLSHSALSPRDFI